MKKNNYKNILKRLNEIQINIKKSENIDLIIAEKVFDKWNTFYKIFERGKGREKRFEIENKQKLYEYFKKAKEENPDCSIILDEIIAGLRMKEAEKRLKVKDLILKIEEMDDLNRVLAIKSVDKFTDKELDSLIQELERDITDKSEKEKQGENFKNIFKPRMKEAFEEFKEEVVKETEKMGVAEKIGDNA